MARVQLNGSLDCLTGSGSRSSSIGGSRESIGSTIRGGRESISSTISGSSWESKGSNVSISRTLGLSGSLISLKELSLSSSNLSSINRGNTSIDRSYSNVGRGHWEVVTGNTETEVISNIVNSVDSSFILISVRSSNSTEGITTLLLGTVDVVVAISKIAIFILSLELGADWASNRGSRNSSHWGSIVSSNRGSNWGSIVSSNRGSSVS